MDLGSARLVLVPLLALPQITHYVLDGFIWRRKSNPGLGLIQDKEPGGKTAATPATCAR